MMMMQIEAEEEERQTDVGILTKFVQSVDDIPHISDELVSSLDIPDLLALRLVSRETKSWVDVVMSKHKGKAFTVNFDEEDRTLDRFMDERKQKAEAGAIPIPFGSLDLTGVTTSSSFFSHPLIPTFLLEYGPKVHRILNSFDGYGGDAEVVPLEELAFYQALPNLTTLSTLFPGENVPQVRMPALRNLKLLSLQFVQDEDENDEDDDSDTSPPLVINVDFLRNCPNLRLLWLPDDEMNLEQYVEILTALGAYFADRNGSSSSTLIMFIENPTFSYDDSEFLEEQNQTERVARLLKELAASDGRILIDCIPITLLDEAVRLFSNQPGKLKLRSFGKCIRSLRGFSSSLYEVELPNMRKMKVDWGLLFEGKERDDDNNGDYTRTALVNSWPNLEEIEIDYMIHPADSAEDLSYMKKLLFGSGVLRPSVKRLDFDMNLQVLSSDAALLLEKLPNLTQLTLRVGTETVGSFRNLMRTLPTSCPKIECLQINAFYRLGGVDFLGGEDGELHALPPLLQLPALKWLKICSRPVRRVRQNDSRFVRDAVFVKVFSLMELEYFVFHVDNLRLTEKAYAAMLEGPFANSILDSDFFSIESSRLRDAVSRMDCAPAAADHISLEILEKLEDRVRENGKKFPWKNFNLRPVLDNVCSDFH